MQNIFIKGGPLAQANCHCPDSRGRLVTKFLAHIWTCQNSFHASAENLTWALGWKVAWLSGVLGNLYK